VLIVTPVPAAIFALMLAGAALIFAVFVLVFVLVAVWQALAPKINTKVRAAKRIPVLETLVRIGLSRLKAKRCASLTLL
jgi:hypothetical protein